MNKNSSKNQYNIDYSLIKPYYLEPKFIEIGVNTMQIEGVEVRIYDRNRTMYDVLRYEMKFEGEVFTNTIKNYIKDSKKNIRNLFEYAEIFNIKNKVQTYIRIKHRYWVLYKTILIWLYLIIGTEREKSSYI